MTLADAVAYLQERVRVQSTTKTSYNRLRWSGVDLRAVRVVLEAIATAGQRVEEREEQAVEPAQGTKRYVIELSAIAPARDDTEAEAIGEEIAELIRRRSARAKAQRDGSRSTRIFASIEQVTVANVDSDFLRPDPIAA